MANIGVRSPYFVNYTDATGTALSSKIQIYQVTNSTATLKYTIVKNTASAVRLDISELARDFVSPTYSSPGAATIRLVVSFWAGLNATGIQIGSNITPSDFVCYDAYNYFSEGNNCDLVDGAMLSNDTIWAPENTAGSFYVISGGVVSEQNYGVSDDVVAGITIKRQLCNKYTPVKCIFINKFGVPQELYFFTRSTESFSGNGSTYKSAQINSDGSYSLTSHQVVDFHKNGKINYTLNTDYVDESYNAYIQELMLSEQVWLDIAGAGITPVRVVTSSNQYKTSLNNKMIDYAVEFEQSNDIISTVR